MNGQPKGSRSARGPVAAMAACSVVAAVVVGGMVLAAPANADPIAANGCATMSTLGSATSSGLSGLVSIDTSSSTPTIGLLGCTVTLGSSSTGVPVSRAQSTNDPSTTDTATGDSTGTDTSSTGAPSTGAATVTTSSASSTSSKLADLSLVRSSNTVYPVKDGYRDSVKFAIRAMNAAGKAVAVEGSVVLSKAGKDLKTWALDGSKAVIDWNGRVGKRIDPGLYTLKVTAWSPDGSTRTSSSMVRVLSKHLEQRAIVVRSSVGAKSVAASLPRELLKAYATGEAVTVRIRTDAVVHGPAKLTFTQNGVSRSVALKNGVHTTKSLPVPAGFDHVTISHDWAKGDARLRSLKAIWSYYKLV